MKQIADVSAAISQKDMRRTALHITRANNIV